MTTPRAIFAAGLLIAVAIIVGAAIIRQPSPHTQIDKPAPPVSIASSKPSSEPRSEPPRRTMPDGEREYETPAPDSERKYQFWAAKHDSIMTGYAQSLYRKPKGPRIDPSTDGQCHVAEPRL
jgi:hypothetical protein